MNSTYSSPKSVTASERGRPLVDARVIAYHSFRSAGNSLTRINASPGSRFLIAFRPYLQSSDAAHAGTRSRPDRSRVKANRSYRVEPPSATGSRQWGDPVRRADP